MVLDVNNCKYSSDKGDYFDIHGFKSTKFCNFAAL